MGAIQAKNLLVKPRAWPEVEGEAIALAPWQAGWEHLWFSAVRLKKGDKHTGETQDREAVLVVLGGRCDVESNVGTFRSLGERPNPFAGKPHALYLPPDSAYEVSASTDLDIAIAQTVASRRLPPRVVKPDEVEVEIRGAANMTRRILHLIPPEFPADKLMLVEVFTPSGNWSSYPPHKHDQHLPPNEHDLEEIYYYRIDRPEGFAIQRVYTPDRRIDETMTLVDGDLVLVPEGYHPVVAAPGCEVYYLNVLAGSGRSMAASDDPKLAWIRDTWKR
jgi:5-deoxy-glucuronate isomerase